MKLKLGSITQYADLDSGTSRQNVPWTISDDAGNVLLEGNQSFGLDASADDIKAFAAQQLATYQADVKTSEEAAKAQAEQDSASAVAQELDGFEITA